MQKSFTLKITKHGRNNLRPKKMEIYPVYMDGKTSHCLGGNTPQSALQSQCNFFQNSAWIL